MHWQHLLYTMTELAGQQRHPSKAYIKALRVLICLSPAYGISEPTCNLRKEPKRAQAPFPKYREGCLLLIRTECGRRFAYSHQVGGHG